MAWNLDLIAADAGSMDAGPFYLGASQPYVGESALRRDLEIMIDGSVRQSCPLIVGSAGFSGSKAGLDATVSIVQDILQRKKLANLRLAVIPSDATPDLLEPYRKRLSPLGSMPPLEASILAQSRVVAQMGIEPIVAALEGEANIVLCGRAYDPALFAADAIRRGYPAGACYHAAKILECGAIACEPGSGSDCLVAEISRQGRAVFHPVNAKRRATARSIAAHTLYEKSKPDTFPLPGGELSLEETRFFEAGANAAGFEGSAFHPKPYCVKLEGSRSLGKRLVSLIPLQSSQAIDPEFRVYGRNGVESDSCPEGIDEIGLIAAVRAPTQSAAKDALAFLRSTLLHYGYEGRLSTAGNLAFPLSPSDLTCVDANGDPVALFVAGTRDPVFQSQWNAIEAEVVEALHAQHPGLHAKCRISLTLADKDKPIALLEAIGKDEAEAETQLRRLEAKVEPNRDWNRQNFRTARAHDAYEWSVHHLLRDLPLIQEFFPVSFLEYRGNSWIETKSAAPVYPRSDAPAASDVHSSTHPSHLIPEGEPLIDLTDDATLRKLARVVRSKNAGINELTYDFLFEDEADYQRALASGRFGKLKAAALLGIPSDDVMGCYRFDPAFAIKVTIRRATLCGSPGDRDAFGAQQHARWLLARV